MQLIGHDWENLEEETKYILQKYESDPENIIVSFSIYMYIGYILRF